jgi:hypothetical protein
VTLVANERYVEEAVNNMEVTLGAVLDIKLLIAPHLTSTKDAKQMGLETRSFGGLALCWLAGKLQPC